MTITSMKLLATEFASDAASAGSSSVTVTSMTTVSSWFVAVICLASSLGLRSSPSSSMTRLVTISLFTTVVYD
ncbi:hypothetical protein ACFPRL_22865 [Pseudoclavibacter helvolus]